MSWYNTLVLSFSCAEYEDEQDESCHDCAALRGINTWLRGEGYDELTDLNPDDNGVLGSNAVLFGVCCDGLDVDGFFEVAGAQPWKYRDDVQVFFWDDNASRCSLYGLPPLEGEEGDTTGGEEA